MTVPQLSAIVTAQHLWHLVFFTALAALLFREATRANGFTRAIACVFAALALNSVWSVFLLAGYLPGITSYYVRAVTMTLLSAAQLWLMVKFIAARNEHDGEED